MRRVDRTWRLSRLAMDLLMLALAAVTSAVGSHAAAVPVAPLVWLVVFPVVVLVLFWLRRLYAPRLRLQVLDDVRAVVSLTAVAEMAVFSGRAALHDDPFLAAQGIRQWLFAAFFLAAGRVTLMWAQRQAWRHGERVRPTLIVGAGYIGRLVSKRLLEHPEFGLRPVGFLDKEPLEDDDEDQPPVLGASWDLEDAIRTHRIEHVIVTFSTAPHHVLLRMVERCEKLGVSVSLVPRLFEKMTERLTVDHLGGLPLVTVDRADPKGWQFAIKYAVDRAAAAIFLLLAAPVMLPAALAIFVTMGRPVFFRQLRVGQDGRVFTLVKFRSMRNAPLDTVEVEGDESHRLTHVGSFLRRTSLDELPQLLNVLRGDMSIVGPRPERPELTALFQERIHRYDQRHRVKSGITGWAQVHGIGRGESRFTENALGDRVEWDNYYIENWSLWLDVKILIMTIAAVLQFRQP